MENFTLDKPYIRQTVEVALEALLDKKTHDIEFKDAYAAVTFKGGEYSTIPNGDGYIISYGGILAEIINLEDTYGIFRTVEEYNSAIAGILERVLESMYSPTIPAIVAIGF